MYLLKCPASAMYFIDCQLIILGLQIPRLSYIHPPLNVFCMYLITRHMSLFSVINPNTTVADIIDDIIDV